MTTLGHWVDSTPERERYRSVLALYVRCYLDLKREVCVASEDVPTGSHLHFSYPKHLKVQSPLTLGLWNCLFLSIYKRVCTKLAEVSISDRSVLIKSPFPSHEVLSRFPPLNTSNSADFVKLTARLASPWKSSLLTAFL